MYRGRSRSIARRRSSGVVAASVSTACSATRCAQVLVRNADRDGLGDQAGGVGRLLHLGRAQPVAGGLDHVVGPSHEVDEAVLVPVGDVARPDGDLVGAGRERPEPRRGAGRVVPVAEGHQRSPVHDLPSSPGSQIEPSGRTTRTSAPGSPCRSIRAGGRSPPGPGRWIGRPRSRPYIEEGWPGGRSRAARPGWSWAGGRRCSRSSAGFGSPRPAIAGWRAGSTAAARRSAPSPRAGRRGGRRRGAAGSSPAPHVLRPGTRW